MLTKSWTGVAGDQTDFVKLFGLCTTEEIKNVIV